MKAAVYYENGGPEVLRYEDVPDPACHPKGVILRVEAIAIEGGDTLNRFGGPLVTKPHIVGYQAAGEIIEVGAEVTHLKVGQKVATVNNFGSHAALRSVPARNCWPVPEGYDIAKASAAGADFDAVAADAAKGIDGLTVDRPGFVVRYAINPQLSAMVWKLGDGEVSGVETLGEQLAIIRVNAIENKPYTEVQRTAVEASGFLIWLDGYTSTAKIAIDGVVVQEAGESPAP